MLTNVYVRMAMYVLSPVLVTIAGLLSGYGVTYDAATQVLSLNLPAVITAVVAALGLSGGIFAKFGIK